MDRARRARLVTLGAALVAGLGSLHLLRPEPARAARTAKPPLHGRHWMAIGGKPLAATAGALMFGKGGNAVDAAAAMLAASCTMWDTLGWGGETVALLYNPGTRQVLALDGQGPAPTGATAAFYREKGMRRPPEYGPLAAVVPGTPGALFLMLAEHGRLSLADVLAPAIAMADGFAIEAQLADNVLRHRKRIAEWPYSKAVFLPHAGAEREAPRAGEVFVQKDLAATLRKLVVAEEAARKAGRSRREAILAAHERFYRGDVAVELVRAAQEQGGLLTMADLAAWKPRFEEPVRASYKGVEVYKLGAWTQGPAMLQALNILETMDVAAMGLNSARYIHAVSQAMHLAFADRDFYYGDTRVEPEEPVAGLLSKDYAKARASAIDWTRNDPESRPGDPYPFQGGVNPYKDLLTAWKLLPSPGPSPTPVAEARPLDEGREVGTTTVVTADEEGWIVSMTTSGAWVPAVIAGRTGIGLTQRMQSFVTDPADGPYNVVQPGQRPRITLTPTLTLKDGQPHLAAAVQGGDTQDQNLLQFFLNVVEFGMTVQEAAEGPNVNTDQMRASLTSFETRPGGLLVHASTPEYVREALRKLGYTLRAEARTSGPINAIFFDRKHGTLWGGSSDFGEDYGIAW